MSTLWKQVKEAAALFSHVYSSNPLPKLNRNMTFFAGVGFISFMTWALLSESTVTILKENAKPSLCTSMKSTFSCKTSDGTSYSVTAANCRDFATDVYAWHPADQCKDLQELSFTCRDTVVSGGGGSSSSGYYDCQSGTLPSNYECQGTLAVKPTFESCTGFINENLISIRIAQALAYSSTLISILSAVYEFFAKRELRKQARERAENADDAQITLDIEAAPAQIALLQLEVGTQKKTIDVLHRTVDVMKKAADASKKAFQKQVDELRQLLTSQRPSPSILPV